MDNELTDTTTETTLGAPDTAPAATPIAPQAAASSAPTRTGPLSWHRPPADVLEGESGLLLVVDLPGVPPDRIEVRTQDRSLTVQGARTDRRLGWRRVFTLPATTDPSRIEARSEHGVLYLTLPTAESAKPRRIEVR